MTDKIYIGIDDKRIEAKGEVLEELLQTQKSSREEFSRIEAAEKEKAEKKESATNKLKALGLTDSEVEALLG